MTYKLVTTTERKYYKYSDTDITYPAANTDIPFLTNFSLLGNNSGLGVKATSYYAANNAYYYPWWAFTNNNNQAWVTNNGYPNRIAWSTPELFKPSYVEVKNATANFPRAGSLDYSDNGEDWTTVQSWTSSGGASAVWTITPPSDYAGFHKYYSLYITSGSNATFNDVFLITCVGTYRKITEGTPSDYDYYEDVVNYKSPVDSNTHQAVVT